MAQQPGLELDASKQPGLEFHPPNVGIEVHQPHQFSGYGDPGNGNYPQSQASYQQSPTLFKSAQDQDAAAGPPPNNVTEKRRILGLTVPVFWGIVIALVLVLAAAIGGGVGGGLSAQNSRTAAAAAASSQTSSSSSSSSNTGSGGTATGTSTASAVTGSSSPAPTDGGCPAINGTTYTPLNSTGGAISIDTTATSQSFIEVCDVNWPQGEPNGNPYVVDIMSLYLSSLEDCMTACAEYNVGHASNGGSNTMYCRSVSILKAGEWRRPLEQIHRTSIH